jgi:hypothetical protein
MKAEAAAHAIDEYQVSLTGSHSPRCFAPSARRPEGLQLLTVLSRQLSVISFHAAAGRFLLKTDY